MLEEGTNLDVRSQRKYPCVMCQGEGAFNDSQQVEANVVHVNWVTCSMCKGKKQLTYEEGKRAVQEYVLKNYCDKQSQTWRTQTWQSQLAWLGQEKQLQRYDYFSRATSKVKLMYLAYYAAILVVPVSVLFLLQFYFAGLICIPIGYWFAKEAIKSRIMSQLCTEWQQAHPEPDWAAQHDVNSVTGPWVQKYDRYCEMYDTYSGYLARFRKDLFSGSSTTNYFGNYRA